jgi:hypothetical protein
MEDRVRVRKRWYSRRHSRSSILDPWLSQGYLVEDRGWKIESHLRSVGDPNPFSILNPPFSTISLAVLTKREPVGKHITKDLEVATRAGIKRAPRMFARV